jgi:hypothetical protein
MIAVNQRLYKLKDIINKMPIIYKKDAEET